MKRVLAAGALLAALLLAPQVARAGSPVSLSEYAARIDQAIDLLNRTSSAAPGERQALLDQAAGLIEEVSGVRFDNGAVATVNNADLASGIRRVSADPAPMLDRLRALRASLDALPVAASPEDRARLRTLLSRPPFKASPDPIWAGLVQQIEEFITRLLRGTAQGVLDQRDLVAAAGVLLALGLVGYLLWNLRRNATPETIIPGGEPGEERLTAAEARGRAAQYATAGDYRSAIRQLYLSTLLLLDERGFIRFDHTLTNREYLDAARDEPALVAALVPVVDEFDRVWYGFERVTGDEFGDYQRRVQQVQDQVAAR